MTRIIHLSETIGDVYVNWTEHDHAAALADGWYVSLEGEAGILYDEDFEPREGYVRGFNSNEDALEFVRRKATASDNLCIKAMVFENLSAAHTWLDRLPAGWEAAPGDPTNPLPPASAKPGPEPALPLSTRVRLSSGCVMTLGEFLAAWALPPTSSLVTGLKRDGWAGGGDVERVELVDLLPEEPVASPALAAAIKEQWDAAMPWIDNADDAFGLARAETILAIAKAAGVPLQRPENSEVAQALGFAPPAIGVDEVDDRVVASLRYAVEIMGREAHSARERQDWVGMEALRSAIESAKKVLPRKPKG